MNASLASVKEAQKQFAKLQEQKFSELFATTSVHYQQFLGESEIRVRTELHELDKLVYETQEAFKNVVQQVFSHID